MKLFLLVLLGFAAVHLTTWASEVVPSSVASAVSLVEGKNGKGYQPKAGTPLTYPLEMMDIGAGTIAFWMRVDELPTAGQSLPLLSSGGPPDTWLYLHLDKGKVGVVFQKGVKPFTQVGEFYINSSVDVSDWKAGSWHHVAFSWAAAGAKESAFNLSVDGKVREEKFDVSLAGGRPLGSVMVGANSARRDTVALSVVLDEVGIWNVPLLSSQVLAARDGKNPLPDSLVLSVDFEHETRGASSAALSPDLSYPEVLVSRIKQ